MNKQDMDVLNSILHNPFINQRMLAREINYSLGGVNKSIKTLKRNGYLNDDMQPTIKTLKEAENYKPRRAIILAAGFGMRMVPINMEVPKGLLTVKGETLIERLIKQLHTAGITEIYVVVGFLKEQYEYLIDEYDVQLVVNPEYASKNNLYSLKCVADKLSNAYIIPCDIWCKDNPFRSCEFYSWYMIGDTLQPESTVRVNRKMELVPVQKGQDGNAMIGICYLLHNEAEIVRHQIEKLCMNAANDDLFWEETLFGRDKLIVQAMPVSSSEVTEINTYEQLRELDSDSSQLQNDAIQVICEVLNVLPTDIVDINVLKKGMTNRSFLFQCKGRKYIMRIPGEGTAQLINRRQEAAVYREIAGTGICDPIIYINADNGYKITEFLKNARVCNPLDDTDLRKCMTVLRQFHELKLKVAHEFDLFGQLQFYESLWDGVSSVYRDYAKTKEKVLSLKPYIESHAEEKVLTHIDAVPDNFLFIQTQTGEAIKLIDWEYAGMQDPHVDIAMFCIYSLYDRAQIDHLIDLYFPEGCSDAIRIKIYCYISVCGLLWSNWCEYKRNLGVEFGEYSIRQYRYAKEYYRIVQEELQKNDGRSHTNA